jgi:cytochrome c-type biogenesis protein CcmH
MKKIILLALIVFIFVAGAAWAQDGGDPNNPRGLTPEQQALAKEIQMELWCPICQGIRLDVCEQQVCEQMREMIDEMILEGKTKQEIIDEFVVQYGVVILGEPPKEGINWLAWIMPLVLVLAGLGFAVWMSRKWTQSRRTEVAAAMPDEGAAAPSAAATLAAGDEDEYLARVEEELGEDF